MKSKLVIGLVTAGLFLAGFGGAVLPASAEPHHFLLKLANGTSIPWTGEPGTAPSTITVAGVPIAVISVQDLGAVVQQVTPPPTPAPTPAPTTPAPTTPAQQAPAQPKAPAKQSTAPKPAPKSSAPQPAKKPEKKASAEPTGNGATPQPTTGHTSTKPQASPETSKKTKKTTTKKDKPAKKDATPKSPDDNAAPVPATHTPPAPSNPTFSLAQPGAAAVGVPNFFIDKFRIPPFLLPIYQAAGVQYGIRWEVLAAINEIETDYGRNLNVSSAGALGWMQFMPATWALYGTDANHDGKRDPYNPVDAIFATARYLKAAGGEQDINKAVFAYNHANWYVDSVLMRARLISGLPADLVGSLTGLTAGPLPGPRRGALRRRHLADQGRQEGQEGQRRQPDRVERDAQGHQHLREGRLAGDRRPGRPDHQDRQRRPPRQVHHAPRRVRQHVHVRAPEEARPQVPGAEVAVGHPEPGRQGAQALEGPEADRTRRRRARRRPRRRTRSSPADAQAAPTVAKERLFANPYRPRAYKSGGEDQLFHSGAAIPGFSTFKSYFTEIYGLNRNDVELKDLKVGSKVIAGTILGRIGKTDDTATHVLFEIRPAGKGAPRVDPKPILDGWKLLESTAIYRAAGKNPFFGPDAKNPSIGQILLMSKESLQTQVLNEPEHQHLQLRPPRHRGGRHRPARPRDARVPRRQRPEADGQLAALRPRLPDDVGQRQRALVRHRRRHRGDQRDPDPRPPGPGLDHRHHDPPPADAAGLDEAAPDHLADDLPGHRQHAVAARPQRPHPRRLPPAVRRRTRSSAASSARSSSPASGPSSSTAWARSRTRPSRRRRRSTRSTSTPPGTPRRRRDRVRD